MGPHRYRPQPPPGSLPEQQITTSGNVPSEVIPKRRELAGRPLEWRGHRSGVCSQHPWAQNPLFTGVPFGLHTGYPPPSTRAPLSTPGGQGVSVCTLALVKGRVQIRTIHFQKLDQRAVQSRVPSKGRSISSETTASFAWPWRASPLRSKFGESPFLFSANVAPIKQCEMTAVLREMVSQEREICY